MTPCRLCEAPLARPWSTRDAKSGQTLQLALCDRCGLVQQTRLPPDEQLHVYYSHHYREDYKATHRPRPKHVARAGRAALQRLQFMRRAGIAAAGAALLDIGAGGGEFCYLAGLAGYQAEGLEPHRGYSEFARDHYAIRVRTCGIDEAPERQFDVVTLFHVLEHLAHPQRSFERMASLLREDGWLVVEVPNIHATDASPHNIYFGAHLFYYSRHSLAAAASRFFDVVHVEDDGNLFMALQRRGQARDRMVVPAPADVDLTRARLGRKGWIEYLGAGGGWRKPWDRLRRARAESGLSRLSPREALDSVWQTAPATWRTPSCAQRPQSTA